ncbi:uncharacterized protein [Panulirus ornatus]|uniref:uncharacterized protein isoform X2 n=1 Tax=Panulirus ornatus TaxID=150431 RepID=UPI003A899782
MGLKRLHAGGEPSYLYAQLLTNEAEPGAIRVIILQKNSFKVKLSPDNESVLKWCHMLDKSPEEYLSQLHKAANSFPSCDTNDEQNDNKENIFEIQQDFLVWKQYFPDEKVYGKRGKFKLEKVGYEDAVNEVLEGTIQDLESNRKCIQNLTRESHEKSKSANGGLGRTDEDTRISSHPSKKAKFESSDSDCYNSDTDVDDPCDQDMDTDEECLVSLSPNKQKGKTSSDSRTSEKTRKLQPSLDSQDLFNNSLEAELYPSSMTSTEQKMISKTFVASKDVSQYVHKSKTNQSERPDSSNSPKKSSGNGTPSTSTTGQVDSQRSIIHELF